MIIQTVEKLHGLKLENKMRPLRLSKKQVCELLSINVSTLNKKMKYDETFPKGYKDGIHRQSSVYFDYEEIINWHKAQFNKA